MHTSFLCGLILLCAAVVNSQEWTPYSSQVQSQNYAKNIQTVVDEDKEAFFTLFNKFLWNDETSDEEGRQFFRRQGVFRRPMPMMFKQQNTVPGGMYRNFADQCYGILCSLGLNGLARTILQLTL